ncbi:MAG: glycosyltransferase family 39 protein [Anaerolineae bacterium]
MVSTKRADRWESWGAWAVVGLAFVLRVYGLGFQSLWRDETDALFFATRPLSRLLSAFAIPGRNGPLYFLLLRGWTLCTGETEFALRYLSVVAGVLALPLTWAVARKLGCGRAGLWALPLLAFSPFLVWYAQDAKMYATVLLAVLLATWLFLKAVETRRPISWVGYALVVGALLYLHLLAFLVVPVHLTWLAMDGQAARQRRSLLVGLGVLGLLALPVALWGVPLFLSDYESGHVYCPPGRMVQALLTIWVGGVAGPPGRWALVGPLFLFLAGVFLAPSGSDAAPGTSVRRLGRHESAVSGSGQRPLPSPQPLSLPGAGREGGAHPWRAGVRRGQDRDMASSLPQVVGRTLRGWARTRVPALRLLVWLAGPVVLLSLISLKVPLFTERYLIWVAPAWYLLLGVGLERVAHVAQGTVAVVCVGVLLVLSVLPLWVQSHVPMKSDFRAAAAYVAEVGQKGDLVLFQIPHGRRTFQYYYRKPYAWAEAPYTNHGQSAEEVGQQMEELTQGYERVWLVLSEAEMWDRRGLTRRWLDEHGQVVGARAFARVEVIGYDLGDAGE